MRPAGVAGDFFSWVLTQPRELLDGRLIARLVCGQLLNQVVTGSLFAGHQIVFGVQGHHLGQVSRQQRPLLLSIQGVCENSVAILDP